MKSGGKIDNPQKCEYCKKPATKGYLWAEGMAYIPVCADHREKARNQIEKTNKDEVVAVREIPVKKKEASMNPRKAFEQAIKRQAMLSTTPIALDKVAAGSVKDPLDKYDVTVALG